MSKLKRWVGTALLSAALVVAPSMLAPAHADTTDADVYTTPGGHVTNDRYWNTACEMYSSNVVRCRTEIWAFTVEFKNGAYQRVEGWAFNNLTYLPSPRANWATNNLGKNAEWTTSEGRKWRTECDTPATGRGGCRSFIWTKQVRTEPIVNSYGQTTGYSFVPFEGWVFNNIMRFSSSKLPAVHTIPAHVLDQSKLGWEGFGPLKIGANYARLKDMGYMTAVRGAGDCGRLSQTNALVGRGLGINSAATFLSNSVSEVHLKSPLGTTIDGARVGMTIGQVKALYGARYKVATVGNFSAVPGSALYGVELQVGRVTQGGKELLFLVHEDSALAITDADKVKRIILREPSDLVFSLCNPGDYWEPAGDPGFGI